MTARAGGRPGVQPAAGGAGERGGGVAGAVGPERALVRLRRPAGAEAAAGDAERSNGTPSGQMLKYTHL